MTGMSTGLRLVGIFEPSQGSSQSMKESATEQAGFQSA